ncbi:MAG: hypothetical protein U9N55_03805 [candidate division Zixibacteria bacterium]|nr:hypothetical protein [candidate division Zixibacteria bacterium]
MKTLLLTTFVCFALTTDVAQSGVDTLKGTADIEDCHIYGYSNCNSEQTGEECRRFNSGGLTFFRIGNVSTKPHRALIKIPGWDGIIPDSSKFLIYCAYENDGNDRKIFLYPLTKQIFEGTEVAALVGDYPDPDSGATWNHAWLDAGDSDSLSWTTSGGDYITDVACTTTVSDTGQYFAFEQFNRILNYWDTSGNDYGFILINENAFPVNTARKTFRSTESSTGLSPMVLLYTTDTTESTSGRRRKITVLKNSES